MPCRSDYMEPQGKEVASREVAQHLVYLLTAFNQPIPEKIQKAADDTYGNPSYLEPMVQMLCGMLGAMSEASKNLVVYNGRIPEARALAGWWDEHQEADRQRIAAEQRGTKLAEMQRKALKKLSAKEIQALGLSQIATNLEE
jgi:hypothetical protein